MAKIELKQPVVQEISENIKDAQSIVLVDYRGLTVEQDTRLRKELREAGITYKVYKNTMMNFAFKGTDYEALTPYLEGPSAIAISNSDATAPARILCKFAKEASKLEVKGGWLKVLLMMRQESWISRRFLQGKNLFPSCSEACSLRLQTSHAL